MFPPHGVVCSHERVMETSDAADDFFLYQFPEPVNGENDVPVLVKTAPVEINRDMAHNQVVRPDTSGNNPIQVSRFPGKGTVITLMQTGR